MPMFGLPPLGFCGSPSPGVAPGSVVAAVSECAALADEKAPAAAAETALASPFTAPRRPADIYSFLILHTHPCRPQLTAPARRDAARPLVMVADKTRRVDVASPPPGAIDWPASIRRRAGSTVDIAARGCDRCSGSAPGGAAGAGADSPASDTGAGADTWACAQGSGLGVTAGQHGCRPDNRGGQQKRQCPWLGPSRIDHVHGISSLCLVTLFPARPDWSPMADRSAEPSGRAHTGTSPRRAGRMCPNGTAAP